MENEYSRPILKDKKRVAKMKKAFVSPEEKFQEKYFLPSESFEKGETKRYLQNTNFFTL